MTIARPRAVVQWLCYGALMFATTLVPLLLWPAELSPTEPNAPMTMAFVVSGLGAVLGGLAIRRDPESGLVPPIVGAVKWLAIPTALTVVSVEVGFMQRLLGTVGLTGDQWLICLALSLVVPVVVEAEKWVRRRVRDRG